MKLKLTILVFLVFLVCSCRKHIAYRTENVEVTALADIIVPSSEEQAEHKAEQNSNSQKNVDLNKRKIIKDGDITIETDSIASGKKRIELLVKKYNGYLSSEKYFNREGSTECELKIRIPAASFDSIVSDVEKGKKNMVIKDKNISSRDVTAEYIDLETRLNNKRAYLQRYNELLKKASSVKDILEIQEKTRAIEEELESTEGKLKYYNDLITYSTLNIALTSRKEYLDKPFFQGSFWKRTGNAFVSGWYGFIEFIIYMFRIWPVWIITAFVFYLTRRMVKKRNFKILGKKDLGKK